MVTPMHKVFIAVVPVGYSHFTVKIFLPLSIAQMTLAMCGDQTGQAYSGWGCTKKTKLKDGVRVTKATFYKAHQRFV